MIERNKLSFSVCCFVLSVVCCSDLIHSPSPICCMPLGSEQPFGPRTSYSQLPWSVPTWRHLSSCICWFNRSTLKVLISQECFLHSSSWDPGYLHFVFVARLGVPAAWRRQFCGTQWRAVQMLCKWLLLLVTRTSQYWGNSQSKGLPEQRCANAKGWDRVGLHLVTEGWIFQKSPLP